MKRLLIIYLGIVSLFANWGQSAQADSILDEEVQKYTIQIEMDPKEIHAYQKRGETYVRAQHYLEAIIDFNRILKTDSRNEKIYFLRGEAYFGLKQWEKALNDFDSALKINPNNPDIYIMKSRAQLEKKAYQEALNSLEKARSCLQTQDSPQQKMAYIAYRQGIIYHEIHQYEQALKAYSTAIELGTDRLSSAYANRGNIYQILSRDQEAMADLNRSIEINPYNLQTYYRRGNLYLKFKQPQNAVMDFSRIIVIEPTNVNALYARARARIMLGDEKGAAEDRTSAVLVQR